MRDDIQPKGLMISTTLRAVMIYQVCDLDKKYCRKRILFCSIFGAPGEARTHNNAVGGHDFIQLDYRRKNYLNFLPIFYYFLLPFCKRLWYTYAKFYKIFLSVPLLRLG